MTHRNEDELLAYALEAVESEEERAGIARHLEACSDCRARLESMRAEIDAIAGVRPSCRSAQLPSPIPRPSLAAAILRAAALIAVGIVAGFGVGSKVPREPVVISPAYVETSPPAAGAEGSAVSDATAIPAAYYEQIVE